MNKRKPEGMCTWTFLNASKMMNFFFKHVITGDKSWIFEYDPETKRLNSEWHTSKSPRQKKARMSKSKIRSLPICFFDSQGVVHTELVLQGQAVNQQYYRESVERLRKRVHRIRPEFADTWMLHHSNALCHTAISVNECLTKKCIAVVLQPPYSPDMSPCDLFLSRNSNSTSKIVILEMQTTSKRS